MYKQSHFKKEGVIFSTSRIKGHLVGVIFLILLVSNIRVMAQEGLDKLKVISGELPNNSWLYLSDASNSLYHYLSRQSLDLLKKRTENIAGLQTLSDWQERQGEVRKILNHIMGPFPEKTPLNPKVTRTIEKEGYRVEHLVFESQPRFYVTGSAFIPGGISGKLPVVIICSGHQTNTYRGEGSQERILNFVKKGFLVFAFDPVGQGERIEYYDPKTGSSTIGSSTREHSYPGAQAFITGSSQAKYMTWDGIRAVDYLLTRDDVDPSRIGITGGSGGGTQSAYIATFDERIIAAAPGNYITSFSRLLQSIGPQDAEQNLPNGIKRGIDHGDLLSVRAPKPAMIYATTRDFFSIQGTMETYQEIKALYEVYGKADYFDITVDHAGHASTLKNREAIYAFFQKHLDNPGNPKEEKVEVLTEEEIQVTRTGQVSTSFGGETVFSLNRQEAEKRLAELHASRQDLDAHLNGVLGSAKRLSGYLPPEAADNPVLTGSFQGEGYVLEKYFVPGEGDYVVPYLLFVPDTPNGKALIYLHPSGKAAEATEGGEIHWFVRNGFTVLAPDLIGIGEMGSGDSNGVDISKEWHASILIGRSIVGIHAGDIVRLTRILERDTETDEIFGLARKGLGPALLHAAAFDKNISRIALVEPYSSYRSMVMNRFYETDFIHSTVAGSLMAYDLPDLAATLAPRELMMVGVTDGQGETTGTENIIQDLSFIKTAYKAKNADEELHIISQQPSEKPYKLFMEWIKE